MLCFVFIYFTFVSLVGGNCDYYRACKKALINFTVIIIRVIADKVDQYTF